MLEDKDGTLKRLGAFAGMLEDCSAIILIHVDEKGKFTFHRAGNMMTQVGALRVIEQALRKELVEVEWDVDGDE